MFRVTDMCHLIPESCIIQVLIIMSKPPALPGDSQSLTFPGVYESLPPVNRSKLTEKETLDEQNSKFKSCGV